MTTIRPMLKGDADAVRRVDAVAFGSWMEQVRGGGAALSQRTRTNILAARDRDPAGCFVAERQGRVVGFIFSRTWGSVGWFGTFAVLPELQGRGIGQRLIAASLDYLRRDRGRVIGLETMPESPSNLGLYLKLGFRVRFLTLQLHKALDPSGRHGGQLPRWSRVDQETRRRWLADLREATDRIRPALDYSTEILCTGRHRLGDTVFLTADGRAVGLATVRLVSSREVEGQDQAVVQPVAIHPAHTDEGSLRRLLEASEELACLGGKQTISLPVNGRHAWALERVLEAGYRVKGTSVRMVLAGTDSGPRIDDYVNLSRWAG